MKVLVGIEQKRVREVREKAQKNLSRFMCFVCQFEKERRWRIRMAQHVHVGVAIV